MLVASPRPPPAPSTPASGESTSTRRSAAMPQDATASTIFPFDLSLVVIAFQRFESGASKGNPGKSGAGAVLMTEDGRVISRLCEGLGVATNNVAEYRGLILGLKYAIRHGFKRIKVYGDSQLVCYQVKGTWQVKKENMMELCKEVKKLQENFISFEVNHMRWVTDSCKIQISEFNYFKCPDMDAYGQKLGTTSGPLGCQECLG